MRGIIRASLAAARIVKNRLDRRLGFPRCHCTRHGGNGNQADCDCPDVTTLGPNCPHVTRTATRIRANPARTVFFLKTRPWMASALLADGADPLLAEQDVGAAYDETEPEE